jgi:DNA invertase Pin-like site-specific DNA recombinase
MKLPKNTPLNGKAIAYIRFSSPDQASGDSERRQGEAAAAYCQKHGLTLVETILDDGISGYTGANRTKGKLTGLLNKIEKGLIPSGTTLIIESFDRLSREDAFHQLSLFLDLMKSGINLVTLDSGMEFTQDSSGSPAHLFLSLASMVRGHEESRVKSERVGAAWEAKRKHASLKPLTARCPLWMELDRSTGKLVLVKDRAKVIQMIFRMAADGMGKRTIAKQLNRQRIKTFGSQSWQDSYIHKILHNKAVIGIYQPYRQRHGEERKPDGDPIAGYYPPAVTQKTWDAVHQKPSLPTGARAARVTNLFTGILIDNKSKSTFQVELKAINSEKPWVYLRPRARVLGLECEDYRLNYRWFEQIFFRFCAEVDWARLSKENAEDIVVGETEEAQLTAQMADLEKRIGNLSRAIETADGKSVTSLITRLQKNEQEFGQMKDRLERIRHEASVEKQSLQALQSAPPLDERNDPQYRRRLQLEIRKRVKKIRVYPHADWSPVEKRMHQNTPGWTTFVVHFCNGALRILTAKNDDAKSVLVHEVRGDWDYTQALEPMV